VGLWTDESKFVTVSPTGRSLVLTDGTPFVVVGETGLMPWLPLRGLYDGKLCDEKWPDETSTCENGSKGKTRNYYRHKIFRCYSNNDQPIKPHLEILLTETKDELQFSDDDLPRISSSGKTKKEDFQKNHEACAKLVQIEGPEVAEEYFSKLKAAGVNVLTVFVESLDLNVTPIFFEPNKGEYNEAALNFLVRLVVLARDNDVYLIFRLYDTYYYKEQKESDKNKIKWDDTYWAKEKEPGKSSPEDFFEEALYPYHKARMQVLFERYKKEPHILGWDLLNEVDNKVRFNEAKFEDRKKWLKEMLAYAKSENPFQLMFYSFLNWDPKDDVLSRERLGMDAELAYRVPNADLAVPHGYYAHIAAPGRKNVLSGYEKPLELARGIAYGFHQIRDGRPILDGEGGHSPLFIDKYDDNFTEDDDKEMFLNSAWLHFVSGGAGANLRWPHDLKKRATINQIPQEWRDLLKIFKDTVGDIPWRGHHLKISHRELDNGIRVMTRTDGRNAVSYWYNPKKEGIQDITLPELDEGWANVTMVNPRTGDRLLSHAGTSLPFTIPVEFKDHLVVVVNRDNPTSVPTPEPPAPVPETTTYPEITSVFSIDKTGLRESTAKFQGGILVNGVFSTKPVVKQLKVEDGKVTQGETITVEGVIKPDSDHVGQKADIIVVALYSSTDISCDPSQGNYYMFTNPGRTGISEVLSNNYCAWIVLEGGEEFGETPGDCHHNASYQDDAYYTRSPDKDAYLTKWDDNKLGSLQPLYSSVLLPEELKLTVEEGMVLYQDKPRYTGHVCINFGYRLEDGTLVFNGDPIQFSVE